MKSRYPRVHLKTIQWILGPKIHLTIFSVDCEVSIWEEGECSANCGGGTRTKSRTVVQQAQNGGTCPELTKLEVCNTEGCKGSLLFQRKQLYLIFLLNISFQSTARLKFGLIGVPVTQPAEEEPRPRPGEFSKKQRMEGQHVPVKMKCLLNATTSNVKVCQDEILRSVFRSNACFRFRTI